MTEPDDGGLVDVSDLSLDEIASLPSSVLGDVLRRILADAEAGVEPVAGFQSAI